MRDKMATVTLNSPRPAPTIVAYDGSERHRTAFRIVNETWIGALFE